MLVNTDSSNDTENYQSKRTTSPRKPVYADVGRAIEIARVRAGLTQAELESSLPHPLTRAAIGNIEAGRSRLLTHMLLEIADVLRVRPRDLLPALPRTTAEDIARAHTNIVTSCIAQGISPEIAERIAHVTCQDPGSPAPLEEASLEPRDIDA